MRSIGEKRGNAEKSLERMGEYDCMLSYAKAPEGQHFAHYLLLAVPAVDREQKLVAGPGFEPGTSGL